MCLQHLYMLETKNFGNEPYHLSRNGKERTYWHMPKKNKKTQTSLRIAHSDQSLRCPHEETDASLAI